MSVQSQSRIAGLDWLALAILALSMTGGGSKFSSLNPLVEAGSILLLCGLIWRRASGPGVRIILAIAGVTALLMLAQMVPLPFELWSQLPGRENAASVLVSIGAKGWQAISLSPHATLAALPTVAVAAALAAWGAQAKLVAQHSAMGLFVMLALAGGLLGLAQFGTGGPYLRSTAHEGLATGFFTNRNHFALTMAVAICFLPILVREGALSRMTGPGLQRTARIDVAAGVLSLSLFAFVLPSFSRSGLLLSGIAVVFALSLLWLRLISRGRQRLRRAATVMISFIIVGALFIAALRSEVDSLGALRRFELLDEEGRYAMWSGTWYAAKQMFPWGSGFGTFIPVYSAFEDLDLIGPTIPNEAHNEYLQIMLEGGLPFVLLAMAVLSGYIYVSVAIARRRDAVGMALSLAVGLVLLHSIVDYPLRSYALLVPISAVCGFLLNRFFIWGQKLA